MGVHEHFQVLLEVGAIFMEVPNHPRERILAGPLGDSDQSSCNIQIFHIKIANFSDFSRDHLRRFASFLRYLGSWWAEATPKHCPAVSEILLTFKMKIFPRSVP